MNGLTTPGSGQSKEILDLLVPENWKLLWASPRFKGLPNESQFDNSKLTTEERFISIPTLSSYSRIWLLYYTGTQYTTNYFQYLHANYKANGTFLIKSEAWKRVVTMLPTGLQIGPEEYNKVESTNIPCLVFASKT